MISTGSNLEIVLYALRDHRRLYSNSIDPREYDSDVVHGDDEEGIAWFFDEILSEEKGLLLLHSNEIGDTVGKIRVLSAAPSNAKLTGDPLAGRPS